MKHCLAQREGALLCVLLSLAFLFACRQEQTIPTARPFPSPDERAIYDMMTAKYTSWEVIFSVYDMSAAESARILRALEAIQPPAELRAVHAQAVRAYRHIVEGKLLLRGADSLLRAEAQFMIDWGVGLLRDYRAQLEAITQQGTGWEE